MGLGLGLGLEAGPTLVRRSAEARRARLRASEGVGEAGLTLTPSEGRGGLSASSGVERLALDGVDGEEGSSPPWLGLGLGLGLGLRVGVGLGVGSGVGVG